MEYPSASTATLDVPLDYRTSSVCAECLQVIEARIVERNGAVFLEKSCAQHGSTSLEIWPDAKHYQWMRAFQFPYLHPKTLTQSERGCPHDCGPCARHKRKSTLVELELTRRCNLRCPVCFMSAEKDDMEPSLDTIQKIFRNIRQHSGTTPGIQLTGGEPTVREDLPQIVRAGWEAGFTGIEVNTNGVVISQHPELLEELKNNGLTGIYLQFDGLNDEIYRQVRGRDLLAVKLAALENCRRAGIQVVLAMTIIDRLNLDQVGKVFRFALDNVDVVAGLALQPAFTSGRFEVGAPRRLNMGDVIFALSQQCPDLIQPYDFYPLGCAHPTCDTGTYMVRRGESFVPATRDLTPQQYVQAFNGDSPQGAAFGDVLAAASGDAVDGLSLIIMNYMDAHTMDIERLRECSMMVAVPDGRLLPFCSYHLTSCNGQRVHSAYGVKIGNAV